MSNSDINKLEEVSKIIPDNPAVKLALGKAYLAVGKPFEAKAKLLEALEIDKTNPDLLLNIGKVCSELNDYKESISYYQKALAIDPYFVEAFYCLAISYIELENFSEVEKIIERLEQLHPILAKSLKNKFANYS